MVVPSLLVLAAPGARQLRAHPARATDKIVTGHPAVAAPPAGREPAPRNDRELAPAA